MTNRPLTNREAAKAVLEAAGCPLHYKEIAHRALEQGLIEPLGKTPAATMGAQLYVAVRKAEEKGRPCEFRAVGRGQFELARSHSEQTTDLSLKKHNREVRQELLAFLREMHPRQMELIVAQLLEAIGFEDVITTQYSNDGGIDVAATLTVGGVTQVRTAVQVKRWKNKNNVSASTVRELRGGLLTDQRGLIITTADYTKDAKREASEQGKTPISLVNGERLVALLVEHQIGIRRTMVPFLELELEDLVVEEEEGTGGKSNVLWPLPGGQKNFFKTTLAFLDQIGSNQPTLDELTKWVLQTYEKVTKRTVVKSYLRAALYSIGLIQFSGERIVLTQAGEALRKERTRSRLLGFLQQNILGVSEILEQLNTSASTSTKIHERLVESLGLSWETPAQTKYRLQWLAACEAIKKSSGQWELDGLH